mgnify:CR=1 FL=1
MSINNNDTNDTIEAPEAKMSIADAIKAAAKAAMSAIGVGTIIVGGTACDGDAFGTVVEAGVDRGSDSSKADAGADKSKADMPKEKFDTGTTPDTVAQPDTGADAGTPDAATPDSAGTSDVGTPDAATPDSAGTSDSAGAPDTGNTGTSCPPQSNTSDIDVKVKMPKKASCAEQQAEMVVQQTKSSKCKAIGSPRKIKLPAEGKTGTYSFKAPVPLGTKCTIKTLDGGAKVLMVGGVEYTVELYGPGNCIDNAKVTACEPGTNANAHLNNVKNK